MMYFVSVRTILAAFVNLEPTSNQFYAKSMKEHNLKVLISFDSNQLQHLVVGSLNGQNVYKSYRIIFFFVFFNVLRLSIQPD